MADQFYGKSPQFDKGDPETEGFFGQLVGGGGDDQYTLKPAQATPSNLAPTLGFFRMLKQGLETVVERAVYFAVTGQADAMLRPSFDEDLGNSVNAVCVKTSAPSLVSTDRRHGIGTGNMEWYDRLKAFTELLDKFASGAEAGYVRDGFSPTLIACSMQTEYSIGTGYKKEHDPIEDIRASFSSWCKTTGTIPDTDPIFVAANELVQELLPKASFTFSDVGKSPSGLYLKGTGVAVDGWGDTPYDKLWTDTLAVRDTETFPFTFRVYWPLCLSYLAAASRVMSAWYKVPGYTFRTKGRQTLVEYSASFDMFGFRLSSDRTQYRSFDSYHTDSFYAGRGMAIGTMTDVLENPVIATFELNVENFVSGLEYVSNPAVAGLIRDSSVEYTSSNGGQYEASLWHRDYSFTVEEAPTGTDTCYFAEGINNDGRERYDIVYSAWAEKYSAMVSMSKPGFPGYYGDLNAPTEYTAYAAASVADSYYSNTGDGEFVDDGKYGLFKVAQNSSDVSFDTLSWVVRGISMSVPTEVKSLTLVNGWRAPVPTKLRVYYLLSRYYWDSTSTKGYSDYSGSHTMLATFPQVNDQNYNTAVKSLISSVIGAPALQAPYLTNLSFLCPALPCDPQFSITIGKGGGNVSNSGSSTDYKCAGKVSPSSPYNNQGRYTVRSYGSAQCFRFTDKAYAPQFKLDTSSYAAEYSVKVNPTLLWWIKINSKFGKVLT